MLPWLFIGIAFLVILLVSLLSFWPFLTPVHSSEPEGSYLHAEELSKSPTQGYTIVLSLILCLAGLTGSLYYYFGEPKVLTQAWLTEPTGEKQLGQLLAEIEKKVAESPDNTEAWLILARGQMMLEDYPKAIASLEAAYGLVDDDAEIIVRLADAHTMNNNGDVSQQALDLLLKAYQLDPLHNNLIWLLAIAYEQRDLISESVYYWRQLETLLDKDPELQQQVRQQIHRLTITDVRYSISITLATELSEALDANAALFVFASEPDGSPMPIAAIKRSAADIPVTITLDNSDSLNPQRPLLQFQQVQITARISNSSSPTPQTGDFFGTIQLTSSQTDSTHDIEINQIYNN